MRQLVNRKASVHAIARFIDNVPDRVAVICKRLFDRFSAKQRLGMAGAKHVWTERHQQIHRIRPSVKIAISCAANGIKIGKRAIEIIAADQHFLFGIPDNDVIWRLARCAHQFQIDAVHAQLFTLVANAAGWRQSARAHPLKRARARTDADANNFIWIRQTNSKLTFGAHLHRFDGLRVIRSDKQRILRKPRACQNLGAAALGKDTGTGHMIAVRVRQNDRLDRQIRDFAKLGKDILCRRSGFTGVDDDQTIIADNHVNIGRRKAKSLVNIVCKLNDFFFKILRMRFEFRVHS